MLKTSGNGTQASSSSGAIKFVLRPTAETLAHLSRPIDPLHLKTRKQGTTTLTYCPWNTIAKHLHHRSPGWCWEDLATKKNVPDSTKRSKIIEIVLFCND